MFFRADLLLASAKHVCYDTMLLPRPPGSKCRAMLCRASKTCAKRATRSVNAMKSGRKYAGSSRFAEQFAASPGAWTATRAPGSSPGSSEEAPSAWTASPASQMPFPGDAVVTRAFVGIGAKWRIGICAGCGAMAINARFWRDPTRPRPAASSTSRKRRLAASRAGRDPILRPIYDE